MRVDEFDFELPEALIALRPARPRSASRMLVVGPDRFDDAHSIDLPNYLQPGDLLVFNDAKVIPARLFGLRRRGEAEARIEATLIERLSPDSWRALARPGKRLAIDETIEFPNGLQARLIAKEDGGAVVLGFDRAGPDLDAAVAGAGVMPLPPYIAAKRAADAQDDQDYQSVFAEKSGAVAAPTASLHFDGALLEALAARGVESTRVTLFVGAGTFLPVKSDTTEGHVMHSERGEIGPAACEAILRAKAAGRRVIPVGTTAMRVIETAAAGGALRPWIGDTDIFITPGYRFKVADGLMTNFHLPRSTLFMLVSAMMGLERMRDAYAHAIAAGYRFYSYGDSSLLLPA